MEDFRKQLIAFWADQYLSTSSNVPEPDGSDEIVALLDMIMEEAFGAITKPEVTIRVWARQDDFVRSHVERVDAIRQEFVLTVIRSVVADERQARLMTDLLSTMLIGSMMVLPRIPPERVLDPYWEFKRLYGL